MWHYENIEIKSIDDLPSDNLFGFVYIIENLTNGRKYIGKKQLKTKRKVKKSKTELNKMIDKRGSKFKYVEKYSNWLNYSGSNKQLSEDIANGHIIKKTILEWTNDKRSLTYLETKYQFIYGVLESSIYYNSNILGKFYKNTNINEK